MKYNSLFDLWKTICTKYSENIAFIDNKQKIEITYKEAFNELCFFCEKFKEYGLERHNHVAYFTNNSPRWLIIEQAIITLGGVCVAKYPEISLQELDYVYRNSDAVILITDQSNIISYFVENNPDFLNNVKFVLYTGKDNIFQHNKIYKLENLLSEYSNKAVESLKTNWTDYPEDIAYISYTSGTSSFPKGAMIKNISMVHVLEQLEENKTIKSGELALATCHISSMGWKAENLIYWLCGCKTVYTHYKYFYETIEKFRPSYFEIPPKILLTIFNKLNDKLKAESFTYQFLFKISFIFSKFLLNLENNFQKNKFFSEKINIIKNFLDKKIFKKLRNTMLNDNVLMDIGSAPLPQKLEDFFQIIGVTIIQSYGATETTGIVIGNTVESQKRYPYTVGIPYKNNIIKIINPETNNEIIGEGTGLLLIKGPTILQGYYKNEKDTKKVLTDDGYYKTGDLVYRNKDGYITILSRYDDVLIMVNGYNIFTRVLENEIKDSEYIKQIVIAGHAKPYLTALVVVDFEKCKNIKNLKEFLLEHINEKIKRKNNYRYYEKIRNIYICKEDFTVENELLAANTLKIKYNAVYEKYKKEIEEMYLQLEK